MVRKPDIQYIRFYTDGSAARALEHAAPAAKTRLPRVRRKKNRVIRLDPLAYAGIAVSLLMLVLMVVNCFQLKQIQQQADRMDDYVDALKEDNARLTDTYHNGYDLKDVEEKALALGMIPIEQARHITVSVSGAETQSEETKEGGAFWSILTDLLEGKVHNPVRPPIQ